MRSPSILTSLSSALVVTLLSPLALAQVPGQAPSAAPAPGAPSPYPAQPAPPWPGQVPGAQPPAAQPAPGAYPGAPGQIPGYPPPGAAQPAPGAYGQQPAPGAYGAQPAPGQPAPGQPLGAAPAPGTPFGAAGAVSLDSSQGVAASADVNAPSEETQEDRNRSLQEQNSIYGSTGLLRTVAASSGATNTFRIHLLTDWFQTSSFLCDAANPCRLPRLGA